MKPLKILNHFFRALVRLIGIGFLISGLEGFSNLFIDGGTTKNIFTLLLRLINHLVFIFTGYCFVRLKKMSILGICLMVAISIIIPFYNLYFSRISNLSILTYQFNSTVVYITILLFFLTFKNSLFTVNQEIDNCSDTTNNNHKNNLHKIFTLEIAFMVVIATIASVVAYTKYKYWKNLGIYNEGSTPTPTLTFAPTIIPTSTATPTPIDTSGLIPPYTAVTVQDDENAISKLILTDKNNQKFVISKAEYMVGEGYTNKPSYSDIKFSPNYKFIYYHFDSDYEVQNSFLYDIENQTKNPFVPSAEFFGFSSDSKYFYACGVGDGGPGYKSGGAIIKQLQPEYTIFKNEAPFKCQYNQSTDKIIFYELDPVEYFENKKEVIISQYNFSEKTGSFLKIK